MSIDRIPLFVLILCLTASVTSCTDSATTPERDEWAEANVTRKINYAAMGINSLLIASKMYHQDYGEAPDSVDDLFDLEYLSLPVYVLQWWRFTFETDASSGEHTAIAAEGQFEEALGDSLVFDLITGEFRGKLAPRISPEILEKLVEVGIGVIYVPGAKAEDAAGKVIIEK